MSRVLAVFLCGIVPGCLSAAPLTGEGTHDLLTVFKGSDRISAQPYYKQLGDTPQERRRKLLAFVGSAMQLARARAEYLKHNSASLRDYFPITSSAMQPGKPLRKSVPHLYKAVFIMGMDEASLQWFYRYASDLRGIKAEGLVVQADSWQRWQALAADAKSRGISLSLVPIGELARSYGLHSYPLLLTPERGLKL